MIDRLHELGVSPVALLPHSALLLELFELRLAGSGGTVDTATQAWTARKTANQKRQDAFNVRMTNVEQRLLRQYSSLDSQLAAAQQSSAALTNALAALQK